MIRELHPSEFELLKSIFDEENCPLLDPKLTRILAAFDDRGLIRGFSVLQLTAHLEPVWVAPTERGTDLWEQLMRRQLDLLDAAGMKGEIYAFAPRVAIERMLARRLGFEKLGWAIMRLIFK